MRDDGRGTVLDGVFRSSYPRLPALPGALIDNHLIFFARSRHPLEDKKIDKKSRLRLESTSSQVVMCIVVARVVTLARYVQRRLLEDSAHTRLPRTGLDTW